MPGEGWWVCRWGVVLRAAVATTIQRQIGVVMYAHLARFG